MTDEEQKNEAAEVSQDSKVAEEPKETVNPEETKQSEPTTEESKKAEETAEAASETSETSETSAAPETSETSETSQEPDILEVTEEEEKLEAKELPFTDLRAGMTVRVHERIIDLDPKGNERERIQVFQGMIMSIKGAGIHRTMTVRRVIKGLGVEKIFPLSSPNVTKVEVVKIARVRQGKLGFLRKGYKKRLKETKVEEEKK